MMRDGNGESDGDEEDGDDDDEIVDVDRIDGGNVQMGGEDHRVL
jgi:hypothetical protein